MKKILISLSIIGVVGAAVIGFTIAYFNDTETSTGNIFVAGTMDLKVDHKYAMYDGNECLENCVEDEVTNLVQNGSFEVPIVDTPQKWELFPDQTTGLQWRVVWDPLTPTTWNNLTRPEPALIEYQRLVVAGWFPQEGNQYAELHSDWSGPANNPGAPSGIDIYQDVPTVPGKQYQVTFWYSPRPGVNAVENGMEVFWNGASLFGVIQANGIGLTSTNWTKYTITVVGGPGSTTRLEFDARGNPDTSMGTFLDNVSVHPINCDYQIIGGTCTLWKLKDLGQGDYYWNFFDVKPGDYGTNIISLHAYDNDAFACLIAHNYLDKDNDVLDPEIAAGDDSLSTDGELSGYLTAFVWIDSNANNQFDPPAETPLYGPNALLRDMKSMLPISLTASHTEYIGVAWCFGEQTVDETGIHCSGIGHQDITQSDSFLSYFTAYAEQQRNNADFDCEDVELPSINQ
jgi:predicted ribosomally synthesized peptide with SipW-like signal peptide